ncbi:hypothetical protein LOTGIDRAFT_174978 [Lottia gigantea]|uniref:CCHC-type domain-containing protein n=1 Tax=Lottia gigantea TaxID=225164 RepID=V4AMJ9_LOTGI|nr:hypothetical protein LOTGIDRAFT_174978 [Lottia gigantea]ESO95995.1 hypothetical protein LOTGIDRAFT_174978 [Lottia gigantea]
MAGVGMLLKDNTVKVFIQDSKKYRACDIIELVENKLGTHSVLACNNSYDVTLINKTIASQLVNEGLINGDDGLHCKFVDSRIKVVSFMHIPVYVNDAEIFAKLDSWGVKPAGPLTRKTADFNGKRKYDGTRFLKVEFPPTKSSLPYATNFDGLSYSIRHNDQEKVCFVCLQPGHIISQCPELKCFKCQQPGHGKRSCVAVLCPRCSLYDWKCECVASGADAVFEITTGVGEEASTSTNGKGTFGVGNEPVTDNSSGVNKPVVDKFQESVVDKLHVENSIDIEIPVDESAESAAQSLPIILISDPIDQISGVDERKDVTSIVFDDVNEMETDNSGINKEGQMTEFKNPKRKKVSGAIISESVMKLRNSQSISQFKKTVGKKSDKSVKNLTPVKNKSF